MVTESPANHFFNTYEHIVFG